MKLTLDRHTFASERKGVLDRAESDLAPAVEEALKHYGEHYWYDPILSEAQRVYERTYAEEAGEAGGDFTDIRAQLATSLAKTDKPSKETPLLIGRFVATASVNVATQDAALDDTETLELEWVTMHDNHVRATHAAADGQRRKAGAPFHIGSSEMDYPGDTRAPLDEWIGCRCVLRPDVPTQNALVADGGMMTTPSTGAIPWHGVLAPEGAPSGDKRTFKKQSLRNRDLPLPLTWQKASDSGHKGSVMVASILGMNRMDGVGADPNLICAWGYFVPSPETDQVIGNMAALGNRIGVSVDLDDSTYELSVEDESVNFTDARISSASIVLIPAFPQAYVSLGLPPAEWGIGPATPDATPVAASLNEFDRGAGWVTDPEATRRIHAYWTEPGQEGYAKIAWGTAGDFDRCRVEVGKYLAESGEPQFINQTCAQWHHDALGIWPATHAKELGGGLTKHSVAGPAASLVASSPARSPWVPPRALFENPHLPLLTPLTYQQMGEYTRVFGHMADFNSCHIGFPGQCTAPPHNYSGYQEFHLGRVVCDDGSTVNVGQLSLGGGHADTTLGIRAALDHYDNISTAFADVVVGEDDFGIWFSGFVRPNMGEQQRYEMLAAKLSCDWREKVRGSGVLELIASCAVNVPGFSIKPVVSNVNGQQVTLIAAGIVERTEVPAGLESNPEVQALMQAAVDEYKQRQDLAARRERLLAQINGGD